MNLEQSNLEDKTTVFLADTIGLKDKLVPRSFTSAAEYLKYLAFDGLNRIFSNPKALAPALSKKLEDELFQIVCNGSENYFLLVHDYVSWAKKQGILCSLGRSSAPGSFVCYCLGITQVDPMINDLIFERFFKIGKKPDIYLEVALYRKQEIVNYIMRKYRDYCITVSSTDDEYVEYASNKNFMAFSIIGLEVLSSLSDMQQTLRKINKSFSLDSISEDDPETYNMISRGDTDGVYQLESPGIQKYLGLLDSVTYDDLVALTSMYRPGPFQFVMKYINAKQGKNTISYVDDTLKEILEPTYGIMVYQEQLMQILHDYAGFDFRESDEIRRTMQKKQLRKHPELKEIFVSEAQKQGHGSTSAEKVFDFLYEFAGYAFPKCHALCQTKMTYWHAYIKCHYPEVFTSTSYDL